MTVTEDRKVREEPGRCDKDSALMECAITSELLARPRDIQT